MRKRIKLKWILAAIALGISFVLLVASYKGDTSPAVQVKVSQLVLTSTWMSLEEFEAFTSKDKCPLCFGHEACEELIQGLKDDSIGISKTAQMKGTVYGVYVKPSDRLKFWMMPKVQDHALTSFEELVCRNASGGQQVMGKRCEVSVAAKSSFLYTSSLDLLFLRHLYRGHLVSRRWIPMTNCPTNKLVTGLVQAFDFDQDLTLTAEEKAILITTVATNPDVAIHKFVFSQKLQFPVLPYFGSCGRLTFFQGPHKPLTFFMEEPLSIRLNMAEQILQLVDSFIHDDPNWVLFTADLHFDNVVVTLDDNRVFLKDLSQAILMDKDLMDLTDNETLSENCDSDCFDEMYDKLSGRHSDSDSINQIFEDCSMLAHRSSHMFSLACQKIIYELLHSLDDAVLNDRSFRSDVAEVQALVEKCANPSQLSQSRSAALELIEIFGGGRQNEADGDLENEDFHDS